MRRLMCLLIGIFLLSGCAAWREIKCLSSFYFEC